MDFHLRNFSLWLVFLSRLLTILLKISNTLLQRIHPIRNLNTKGLLDGSLIQYRISRTSYRRRILRAITWLDITFRMTGDSCNHLSEIIPGADTLVWEMIYSNIFIFALGSLYLIKYGDDGISQIKCVCRSTSFIALARFSGASALSFSANAASSSSVSQASTLVHAAQFTMAFTSFFFNVWWPSSNIESRYLPDKLPSSPGASPKLQ